VGDNFWGSSSLDLNPKPPRLAGRRATTGHKLTYKYKDKADTFTLYLNDHLEGINNYFDFEAFKTIYSLAYSQR
jgi:hypothetical protein